MHFFYDREYYIIIIIFLSLFLFFNYRNRILLEFVESNIEKTLFSRKYSIILYYYVIELSFPNNALFCLSIISHVLCISLYPTLCIQEESR